jgi:MFS family permease
MRATGLDEGEATIRKIMWRIMPLLMGMMLLSVIDRSNVGFAKLQMVHDLKMTETTYGLASSLFFIGYSIFEVPSALAAHRFGARLWFARIMITWGILTMSLAFTFTGSIFATVRILIGVAEAGAYPGIIFYLTLWFPKRYRVQAVALLTIGSPLGNMFGSLFGGALLDLDGMLGLAGWQWVFLVTGAPTMVLVVLILRFLPNNPKQATFLSDREKTWLQTELLRNESSQTLHGNPLRVLTDVRVLWFAFCYTLITLSLYGIIYWLPTVVKGFGATGTQNGLLNALPWAAAALILAWLPRHLREHRSVLLGTAAICLVGLLAFVGSVFVTNNVLRYVALAIGTPCISLLFPCIWYLPSQVFRGAHAAAAIATISTIGSLGGFAAQNLMPWVAKTAESAAAAMIVPAASLGLLALSALLMLMVWHVEGQGDDALANTRPTASL